MALGFLCETPTNQNCSAPRPPDGVLKRALVPKANSSKENSSHENKHYSICRVGDLVDPETSGHGRHFHRHHDCRQRSRQFPGRDQPGNADNDPVDPTIINFAVPPALLTPPGPGGVAVIRPLTPLPVIQNVNWQGDPDRRLHPAGIVLCGLQSVFIGGEGGTRRQPDSGAVRAAAAGRSSRTACISCRRTTGCRACASTVSRTTGSRSKGSCRVPPVTPGPMRT